VRKIGADCRALLIRVNSRDSRARNSCQFVIFDRSKKLQKKPKKSLPAPGSFIKREVSATNRPRKPFKKTLKKVKKKLVSALEI